MTTVKTSTPPSPETGDLTDIEEALAKWRDAIQKMRVPNLARGGPTWDQSHSKHRPIREWKGPR